MPSSTHCTSFYPTPGVFPSWACPRGTLSTTSITVAATPSGATTGVCVFLHPSQNLDAFFPYAVPNDNLAEAIQGFATHAATSGWVTLYPPYTSDFANGGSVTGANEAAMHADLVGAADTGQTFVNECMVWWDHMVAFCHAQYPGLRIAVAGYSLGAWLALEVAKNRTSSIVGYAGQCIPTLWQTVNTTPSFGDLTTTSIDQSTTYLSGVSLPGWIGWGTTDNIVGFSVGSSPPSNCQAIAASAGGTVTTYNDANNHLFTGTAAFSAGNSMATWIAGI